MFLTQEVQPEQRNSSVFELEDLAPSQAALT